MSRHNRYWRTGLLLAILWGSAPVPVHACSGFIDCLFGFTERTEVRAERDLEKAKTEAERDVELERVRGEEAARLREADAEVERVKQMRFATEADRDIAVAQAQAQAEQYKAMIRGLTDERVEEIQALARTQVTALQETGDIMVEGIVQTGKTERWRIILGWATVIVALVILGRLAAQWLRRQEQPNVVVMLPTPRSMELPWMSEEYTIELREVKNGTIEPFKK